MIRPATRADADAIARIYNHYVANTPVTFETDAVSAAELADRIDEVRGDNLPWLVSEADGQLLGYAYAGKWKGRCAYRFSVETTVYLDARVTTKGLGTELYSALLDALRNNSTLRIHAVIGGVALPNAASVRLHEKLGFVKVAEFKEVGFKFDRWIDVGYWELLLR